VAERGRIALFCVKVGLLVIQLNKSDRAHCIKLSFEVSPNSDFGDWQRAGPRIGVRSELRNDSIPGMGQVLAFQDDKGTTIELFKTGHISASTSRLRASAAQALARRVLQPRHPAHRQILHEQVLGFRVSRSDGDFFCFMRCNPDTTR